MHAPSPWQRGLAAMSLLHALLFGTAWGQVIPPPEVKYFAPRTRHLEYQYVAQGYHPNGITVSLTLRTPGGGKLVIAGGPVISGQYRLADMEAGDYVVLLEVKYWYMADLDSDGTPETRLENTWQQPLATYQRSDAPDAGVLGQLLFDETLKDLSLGSIDVTADPQFTLNLTGVTVRGSTVVNGAGLSVEKSKLEGGLCYSGGRCQVRSTALGTALLALNGQEPARFQECKVGGINATGGRLIVEHCSTGGLALTADSVQLRGVLASSPARILATNDLSVAYTDFYPPSNRLDAVIFQCPQSALHLYGNGFAAPVVYQNPDLSGGSLDISMSGFYAPKALTVTRTLGEEDLGLRRRLTLSGANYFGGADGARRWIWPGLLYWLDGQGGEAPALNTNQVWLPEFGMPVSGRSDVAIPPAGIYVNSQVLGQNVLAPDYTYVRKGRPVLAAFDLRRYYETAEIATAGDLVLQIDGRELVRPENPDLIVRRDYGPPSLTGAGRTLNFLIPAREAEQVTYRLIHESTGALVENGSGSYQQRARPARPLRLAFKQMFINAFGYSTESSPVTANDSVFHQFRTQLREAVAAMLPLTKDQVIVEDLLPGTFTPRLENWIPHFGVWEVMESVSVNLQGRLDEINADRGPGRAFDFILGVLPKADLRNLFYNEGVTGVSYARSRRAPVIADTMPVSALHEIGHAFGLYLDREQYDLPTGWSATLPGGWPYAWEAYLVGCNGARVWGVTGFAPEDNVAYDVLQGRLRHFPAGIEQNCFDLMGGEFSDFIIPATHNAFVQALYLLLGPAGEALPGMVMRAPQRGSLAASGTRRVQVEGLIIPRTLDNLPIWETVPESLVCQALAADTPGVPPGQTPSGAQFAAYDAQGFLLGKWFCYYRPSETTVQSWIQTFDVPANAVRYAVIQEALRHVSYLNPVDGSLDITLRLAANGRLSPPPNSPGPTVLAPTFELALDGRKAHPSGRPLPISLFYSTDGQATWSFLGRCDEAASTRLESLSLPVSEPIYFKARISDGFQEKSSVLGPLTRRALPPMLAILDPWEGAVAPTNASWRFTARTTRSDTPASLRWSSSRDGLIATDAPVLAARLSPGAHRILCIASDASGLSTTQAVQIRVGTPDSLDFALDPAALTLAVTGQDPLYATPSTPVRGRTNSARLVLRNPGVEQTARVRVYYQDGAEAERLVGDETFMWEPLQRRSVAATFVPRSRGPHVLRGAISVVSPTDLLALPAVRDTQRWVFTNHPPVALGSRLALPVGEQAELRLQGADPDGDALRFEIVEPPAHGTISGMPPLIRYESSATNATQDRFRFRVSDGLLSSAPASFDICILPAQPQLPTDLVVTAKANVTFRHAIPAKGQNLHFRCPTLSEPGHGGVSLDPKTGGLSGLVRGTCDWTLRIEAENELGLDAQFMRLRVIPNTDPPQLLGELQASGKVGVPFSYSITAENYTGTFLASNLPPNIFLNEYTGIVSGTPSSGGLFRFGVGASNAFGATWATVQLRVLLGQAPPQFVRLPAGYATAGQPFLLPLADTVANDPHRYIAEGLPPGLALDGRTGVITGTPLVSGSFPLHLTVINTFGQTRQDFSINVQSVPGTPVVTTAFLPNAIVGQPYSVPVATSPAASHFEALGLPDGVTINPATGVISGTPREGGGYSPYLSVWILARNATGVNGRLFSMLLLHPAAYPLMDPPAPKQMVLGEAFEFSIPRYNNPTAFGASGLPPGLLLNRTTGIISGRPMQAGHYAALISATNGAGSVSRVLDLTITPSWAGWLSVNGLSGDQALPLADPEADGFPNLAEYAFQLDPNTADHQSQPWIERRAGAPYLVFRVWTGGTGSWLSRYSAGGVSYHLETAPDVGGPWVTDVDQFDPRPSVETLADGTTWVGIPILVESQRLSRFYRLRLSLP